MSRRMERTDSHASDIGHWLGMTALSAVRAVVRPYDGTSKAPSPTFVIRQARLSLRRGRCPHRPAVGNRIPAAGHAGPALQGVCVRADRVVRRDGISAGTRAVEHQGTHRGRGQRRATAHRGKLWRHNPLNREKPGNRLRVGQVSAKSQPTRVRKS